MPSFHKTSDVSTFKIFWFVAVRSFTADSSLLQPTGGVKTGGVNTTPHTSIFHSESHAHAWLKFGSALIPSHVSCVIWCVCLIALSSTTPFSSPSSPSSLLSPCPFARQLHLPGCGGQIPCALPLLRTLAPWPRTSLPQVMSPTTTSLQRLFCVDYTQKSLSEQRFPDDFDYNDVTIGKTLLDACRRRADHSEEEGLSFRLSSSVSHDRTGRPCVAPFDSQVSSVQEIQRHSSESEQIRILLERQREQILADCQAEIRKHEFQADNDRRSIQKLNETIESQKEEFCRAHQGDERRQQDQQLLQEQLLKQNWDLREAHEKSLSEMEELKRFQGSTFDTIARRKLVEDQDTILELTGKIQELQNEINCMNDSRDFQDAESARSGHSHVASQPVFFPPHPVPGGMLSRSKGMPSRKNGPPSICDTHGISGNIFANPAASSSAPYPQELNPWSSQISKPIHSS